MKRVKILAVVLGISVLAFGMHTLTLAQTDSVDSAVTVANQAVFIELTTDFTAPPTDVTAADVRQGFTSIGTATVTVDATSFYDFSATTNFAGTTTGTTAGSPAFNGANTVFTACQLDLDTNGFQDGDPGPSLTNESPTIGDTDGVPHTIGMQLDWTQYSDAPNGDYTCHVQVTVTD